MIKINDIKINQGRRKIDEKKVLELSESIKQLGLLNPITINKDNTLIAGNHRIEACKLLGWDEIEVNIIDLSGLLAELAEIDENLIRNELHWLEIDKQLARRKVIFEELNPETKKGIAGAIGKHKPANGIIPFAQKTFTKDTADKLGQSQSNVQKSVARGEKIINEIEEDIKELDITKTEGTILSRQDADKQKKIIETKKENKDASIKEIIGIINKEERTGKRNDELQLIGETKAIENNEIIKVKYIPYDENIFTLSPELSVARYGDKIMSLSDEKYYTATTLERFFHRENLTEFSLREYAEVQTFPNEYKFIGTNSEIKKQIGNAVAPFMGAYISKKLKGKTAGDLFSGCGGFSCGLHKNGIKTKWAVEWEKAAAMSFKLNNPNAKVLNTNIKSLDPVDFEKVDIIIGGPPCQGFSSANSNNKGERTFTSDSRNVLYKEFLRFVNIIRPNEFIMENVKEIQDVKNEIIEDFDAIGYDVTTELVKGNDIGMKQNRVRFFFLGTKRHD